MRLPALSGWLAEWRDIAATYLDRIGLATDLTGRAGCLNGRSSRKSQLSLDNELPRRVPCLSLLLRTYARQAVG